MIESITRNRSTVFKERQEHNPQLIVKVIALRLKKILQIDPRSGHFHERQRDYNFRRYARQVFLKIDLNLNLGLKDHSVKCTANFMAEKTKRRPHNHRLRQLSALQVAPFMASRYRQRRSSTLSSRSASSTTTGMEI